MIFLTFAILLGVILIDYKLGRMMAEQERHNRQIEEMLTPPDGP